MHPAIGVIASYVIGSTPSAYIAGRVSRGIDLREHGSGNLGATNAYRVLGARVAAAVFALDVAKGALPVMLFPRWTTTPSPTVWAVCFGAAAIIGHVRPVFLGFKAGGKGVATATGMFLALAWLPTLIAMAAWGIVLKATGFVSLASLVSAVVLPSALLLLQAPRAVTVTAALVSVFVIWGHRANIGRLSRGEEHRFGRRATPDGEQTDVARSP